MSRAVPVLFLIAAGLGVYLWLVEVPSGQKKTETEAAAKKLLDIKEEDVQALTITSPQGQLEIHRDKDGWALAKPKPMEADAGAVDEFLRTLLLTQISRVVDDAPADPAAYGLASPHITVSLQLATGSRTVRLGDSAPLSGTLYAARDDAPKVFLTTLSGRDLFKDVQDFRRRQVFGFSRSQVTRMKVATPRETVVLYKEGHGDKENWTIKSPAPAPADQPEVRSLLLGLQDLKAQGFVDDPKAKAAARAAAGAPLAAFTLHIGEEDRTLTLFIDSRDKKTAYAESTAEEPLYRISPAIAQDLAKGLFALRSKQLIAAEPDRVKTLVIKKDGREFSLVREGNDWLFDGDPAAKADAARTNMFVTRAVRLQAERVVTEKPADFKAYGLAAPTIELIAADEQGKILGRIAFGRQEQGLAYAAGSAMPGVFQVRPDILKDIPAKEDSGKSQTQGKEKGL